MRGASDATYLVQAFGDELLMQLQLNVHRLVVVYRVPALDALDAATLAVRLERWRLGAEHAGWKNPDGAMRRSPATPSAAMSKRIATHLPVGIFSKASRSSFIGGILIVQMTRYYMLEAARSGIRLVAAPRRVSGIRAPFARPKRDAIGSGRPSRRKGQ